MPAEQEDDKSESETEQEQDIEKEQESDPEKAQEQDEEEKEEENSAQSTIQGLKRNSEISLVPKSALMPHPSSRKSRSEAETEIVPLRGSGSAISWTRITENPESEKSKNIDENSEKENPEGARANSLLENFLLEHQRHKTESNTGPILETEYVSLEKLAETVNTCRVCNEKFKDMAHLDAHRAKAGHFQCNIPDCSSLRFTSAMELSMHKAQIHGAPLSPSLGNASHQNSPRSHHSNSPHLNRASPLMNTHSPHSPSLSHQTRGSPMTSPHTNSPTYQPPPVYPGVSIDQLPAPVQQLAQQVQRMPLPQTQLPPGMPPGANTMIPGPSYYPPPGRPPMYRVQAPMHYPPHMANMYQQYGQNPYPQMGVPPGMQPQMQHQIPRGRYPAMIPGQR